MIESREDIRWDGWNISHPQEDLRCEKCEATYFRLRYGTYSLTAKCAACGHQQEVYSG